MSKDIHIQWSSGPEAHDYPAAESYLSLLYDRKRVTRLIKQLKQAPISKFKAKDVFRASGLSLRGEKLSPFLLVRDERNGKLVIADGYHRMCSVYSFDEDALIPCKIV